MSTPTTGFGSPTPKPLARWQGPECSEILNAKDLSQQGNPLEHAATDANTRLAWLPCAYIAFAATFILTIVLTTLTAIIQ